MSDAPSVEYPVGRCVLGRRLLAGLVMAWLVAQAGWWWGGAAPWPNGTWWFATGAGSLLLGWWAWKAQRPVAGRLEWEAGLPDGRPGRWIWHSQAYRSGTPLQRVEWVLDAQGAVLLRLANADGRTLWVCLERSGAASHWDDLRRALQANRHRLVR